MASRQHVKIVVLVIGLVLEDLQSTNGVYVNGGRVKERVRLHAGDRILVGTTEVSVFSGTDA